MAYFKVYRGVKRELFIAITVRIHNIISTVILHNEIPETDKTRRFPSKIAGFISTQKMKSILSQPNIIPKKDLSKQFKHEF